MRESTIVKRLYLTEADNIMSTQSLMIPLAGAEGGSDDASSSDGFATAANERIELLAQKIQDLKAEIKDKDDSLALKSRLIEQVKQIVADNEIVLNSFLIMKL